MNIAIPDFVRFGRDLCGDLAQAERREWWLGNSLGAYAAGTVAGTLTRRYHGLLIAPLHSSLERFLVFAKADASLILDDQEIPLFSNRWGDGVVHPRGHVHLESFHLQGRMPVWRFAIGAIRVEMRLWLEPGANTTYLSYKLESSVPATVQSPLQLRVRLLVNARNHHVNTRLDEFDPQIDAQTHQLRVLYPDGAALTFKTCDGEFSREHSWIENFDLPVERERGLPDRDNHLCVGELLLALHHAEWTGFIASLHNDASPDVKKAMRRFTAHDGRQLKRARLHAKQFLSAPEWINQLVLAADSFLFARPLSNFPEGESVIAGYPWFNDWGRDTMIALPGLTLATGRFDSARQILQTFAHFVDQGMLPNVFPDIGEHPDYNTVDAALWYVEAWHAYFEATDDRDSLAETWPVLEDIITWYVKGTRYRIKMDDSDGLLYAGKPGVQLTWMDAKVGDWVVTPRIGKPVEINALWYNALCCMAQFAVTLGRDGQCYRTLAEHARSGFQRFVRVQNGGLYDVLDSPHGNDKSVRPNQIFAASLPYSALDSKQQAAVVTQCGYYLLTSYGLRSLAPDHCEFRAHYSGGVWERDGGYHQGAVMGLAIGALCVGRIPRTR